MVRYSRNNTYRAYKKYGKRKRTSRYTKKKSKAARAVQGAWRRYSANKTVRRGVRRYKRAKLTRFYNDPNKMSAVTSFSCYLGEHCFPRGNYYDGATSSQDTIVDSGLLAGSAGAQGQSPYGQIRLALQCGPLGFYKMTTAPNVTNFRALNSRCAQTMGQWKAFKIISTTYTFTPYNGGRGLVDETATAPDDNTGGNMDYKNLLFWSCVDLGDRDLEPTVLLGWTPPLPGPPTPGVVGATNKYSLKGDSENLCDKTVKLRYLNSDDRKSFKITVKPAAKDTQLWQIKKEIVDSGGTVTDVLRTDSWGQCQDWLTYFSNGWTQPAEVKNNADFPANFQHPPLSIGCQMPIRFDSAGNVLQVPVFRVSVKQTVRFRGRRSTPV